MKCVKFQAFSPCENMNRVTNVVTIFTRKYLSIKKGNHTREKTNI